MDLLRTINNKIYAVVKYMDDYLWNEDEMEIFVFYNEDEYKKVTEEWNELQEHTGCGWKTLYKRDTK